MRRILIALAVSSVLAGCTDDPIMPGGPCFYTDIPGTATIRTVTPDTSASASCPNKVIIIYDFAPDDPTIVDRYRIPSWPDTGRVFLLVNGSNVPDGWAVKEGMTPGTEHPCLRHEIYRGACTPVVFEFTEIDTFDWEDYCD